MIRADNDRRWKCFYLNLDMIIHQFLIDWQAAPECMSQLRIIDAPLDYVIDQVHYSAEYQSYAILIYHPSFDIVPHGERPPTFESRTDCFYIPKCRDREEAYRLGTLVYKTEEQRLSDFFESISTAKPGTYYDDLR